MILPPKLGGRVADVAKSEETAAPRVVASPLAPVLRSADLRAFDADPITRGLSPLAQLPQALSQLRPLTKVQLGQVIDELAAGTDLFRDVEDLKGRLRVSSSPSLQLAHLLFGLSTGFLGFTGLYGLSSFDAMKVADLEPRVLRAARQIGLDEDLIRAGFLQNKVDRFTSAVIQGSTARWSTSERQQLTAHLLRRLRYAHAMPPPAHVRSLLAEARDCQISSPDLTWLESRMQAVKDVELCYAGGQVPPDRLTASLSACIELVARGWCTGGAMRGTLSGWFERPTVRELLPSGDETQIQAFEAAIAEAKKLGPLARTRDNLTIDRMNPQPRWSDVPKVNTSDFDYLRTAYSYWMLAGKTELAADSLTALAKTETGRSLGLLELPLTVEGFEELAKSLLEPNDIQKDKVYWWVGQLRANLELAYRELPQVILRSIQRAMKEGTDAEVRILHLGSADGSQSFFLAAAAEWCLGQLRRHPDNKGLLKQLDRVRIRIDAVDYLERPGLSDGKITFVQKKGPLIPTWPLVSEEITIAPQEKRALSRARQEAHNKLASFFSSTGTPPSDVGETFESLRLLHQSRAILSASHLLEATIDSVPFSYRRPGSNRDQKASGVYRLGNSEWSVSDHTREEVPSADPSRRFQLQFHQGDAFDPSTYPTRDYDLAVMTNVLPWIAHSYGQAKSPSREVLDRALDALAQRTRPEAAVVLDLPAVFEFDAPYPPTKQHNTPGRVDEIDYGRGRLLPSDKLDLRRVLLADSKCGLITIDDARQQFPTREGTTARAATRLTA
ncbi:MAG: hypothetical protein IT384_22635 [Deltaproteobacteria bacterium]|nr:hypothetical protein [Deltaproteobacteria bacterium]